MSVYCGELNIETNEGVDIVDITSNVQDIISKSKIKDGIVCVFVPGSTGTLTSDFPRFLEKIAPKGIHYDHHETWHDDNGHYR